MLENRNIFGALVSENQEWSQICTGLEQGLTSLAEEKTQEFGVNFLGLTQNLKILACNC